ncbi:MAG: sugar transferase [Bacteroidota bacterium]|nr:sugar transferase [Bacteroidota bacterium]
MHPKRLTYTYIISDFISSALAWTFFFIFRKIKIENQLFDDITLFSDNNFLLGIIIIPLFWIFLYFLFGYYTDTYRKSRLKEISKTFSITLLGVLVIFFKLILDDIINTYTDYYILVFTLLIIQFSFIYLPRLVITSIISYKIHSRKIGFPTLLIGANGKTIDIYNEISNMKTYPGNKFVGFVSNKNNQKLAKKIKYLGDYKNIHELLIEYNIQEVIIAIESSEHDKLRSILNQLILTNVKIKIIPSLYDIFSGYVKLGTLYSTPLIEIPNNPMDASLKNTKRVFDIFASIMAVLILFPFYIFVGIGVLFSSRGPIFYLQERIGKNGKPFKIIKFRTMYPNAEKHGPALSSDNDKRITPWGKFLRKTRLDEIPQFVNVLIGNMSIVGPRPERKYYINKIVPHAPYYLNLLKVKPGITSLGEVKYGYAENVEEMIVRMKYDITYLQNISLYLDFKILILTVKTILQANGK